MGRKNEARLLHGEIIRQWTLLDCETVGHSNCDRAQLVGLLMTHYGFSPDRAAREVDRILAELDLRLKLAA